MSLGLCAYLRFSISLVGKQAMMNSKQGSGKRPLQERNFEIVVNHITINEDQLPQVSRQSMAALKNIFGHNIKKYSCTFHHKPGNDHVHILVVSEAPKTKSAVKVPIAASMALIFGTETGFVEVKMCNEMKADAGPAHGLKGLGDYRSLYVDNNDHANHRPKDAEHRTVEFMCSGDWEISHGGPRKSAGRPGPVQVVTAAIKAGTPEFQFKTYEECQRLLEAAAESVGCTKYTSMKYLQGLSGTLRKELVVAHELLVAHPPDFYRLRLLEPVRKLQSGPGGLSLAKLKQHYEEAFINLFGGYLPAGWTAGRAPAGTCVTYNLPAAVIADVMKAK